MNPPWQKLSIYSRHPQWLCLLPLKWNCGHTTYVGTQLDISWWVRGEGGLAPIFVHFTECIDIVEGTKINHNISSQIKIMPSSIYSIKKQQKIKMKYLCGFKVHYSNLARGEF